GKILRPPAICQRIHGCESRPDRGRDGNLLHGVPCPDSASILETSAGTGFRRRSYISGTWYEHLARLSNTMDFACACSMDTVSIMAGGPPGGFVPLPTSLALEVGRTPVAVRPAVRQRAHGPHILRSRLCPAFSRSLGF